MNKSAPSGGLIATKHRGRTSARTFFRIPDSLSVISITPQVMTQLPSPFVSMSALLRSAEMPRVDSGAGPRVLFKTEKTSSQTQFAADAHSRDSEAGEKNNRLDAMILACAIIRRSKRLEGHHPKCARPQEVSVAV